MILFVGDVDRAMRDREDSRRSISRPSSRRSPSGRRGSTMRRASPNTSPAPMPRPSPDGPARWSSRCPRTCCDEVEARPAARSCAPAQGCTRGDDPADGAARRPPSARSPSSAAPAGSAPAAGTSRDSRRGSACRRHRVPPPGRAGHRRRSRQAIWATVPIRSWSSGSRRRTCCWSSARGWARRPPTAIR